MKTLTAVLIALSASLSPAASIGDLADWTMIEDPAHPGMSASVDIFGVGVLTGDGAVPSGTDIGYASVNGSDVASSTAGFYFDPSTSFSLAITFDFSAMSSIGAGGIGFGIGEDIDGTDSAGVGLAFINGVPALIATAGRVNDVDEPLSTFATMPVALGRFFVEYDSVTQDVILGVSNSPGSATPLETKTLAGIGSQWDGEPLLASFFLRSQSAIIVPSLSSGQVEAQFSNLTVLSGTPISIPEPATSFLAISGALGVLASRRLGGPSAISRKTVDCLAVGGFSRSR